MRKIAYCMAYLAFAASVAAIGFLIGFSIRVMTG
jgi:hypothetical protein